ncbi:MAG: di-trans,poly-cis-decaprenylcistransferase [Bdellovibrio sp.]|nr:MAG: di-trans,poly-cis-decaprenylcistransferase [Bdellovibrio sp.]
MVNPPSHIGIIMDGNGRWARRRNRPRTYGHIKGARVCKQVVTRCAELGVRTLTLFAFSSENWLRPQSEVSFLMKLLRKYLRRETKSLIRENIRFTTIGDLNRLPADLVRAIEETRIATERNSGLNLIFAINYGARQEITAAVREIAAKVGEGLIDPRDIDESVVHAHLQTFSHPDPDLIIRTSGEYRLSNFLLWQSAYSELLFTPTLWPDFSARELEGALQSYQLRERRFGQVPANATAHP